MGRNLGVQEKNPKGERLAFQTPDSQWECGLGPAREGHCGGRGMANLVPTYPLEGKGARVACAPLHSSPGGTGIGSQVRWDLLGGWGKGGPGGCVGVLVVGCGSFGVGSPGCELVWLPGADSLSPQGLPGSLCVKGSRLAVVTWRDGGSAECVCFSRGRGLWGLLSPAAQRLRGLSCLSLPRVGRASRPGGRLRAWPESGARPGLPASEV